MAERRMFCKSITESDQFLCMPADAQALYFHLNMASDDDGFCDNPRTVMRQCGASDDSMKILRSKKFILTFDKNDGFIVVIKHWRMNNYIRKDTYRETRYKEFLREMYYDENQSYSMNPDEGHIPCVPSNPKQKSIPSQTRDEPVTEPSQERDEPLTQDSIGKVIGSLEEESIDQVKDNSINTSTLQIGEIGDCKGEEQSVPPDRSERAEYWKRSIALCEKNKWDSTNLKQMAAAEGIIL